MNRAFTFLAVTFLTTLAAAQEPPPPPKPLPEHKILADDAGTWEATIKTYMGGADSEPAMSKGMEVNEVMTGGMWVVSRFDGKFGDIKFEGRGQFGFDPVKKKYVGTWIDSMSTILSVLEGEYDDKTKTMTYVGDGYDPDRKAKFTQKMVTVRKDKMYKTFTLSMQYEGEKTETKFMEISYTRRK